MIVRRRVQVIDAIPDPGAFTAPRLVDEEAEARTLDVGARKPSLVLFGVYLEGRCIRRTTISLSQQELDEYLKTGETPSAPDEDADAAETLGPVELVR